MAIYKINHDDFRFDSEEMNAWYSLKASSGDDVIIIDASQTVNSAIYYEDENYVNRYEVSIDAGDGNDQITFNAPAIYYKKKVIGYQWYYGEIIGGKGNDTITTGDGLRFFYDKGDGNDVISLKSFIKNYIPERLDILLRETSIESFNYKNGDYVFTVDSGNIKVTGTNANTKIYVGHFEDRKIEYENDETNEEETEEETYRVYQYDKVFWGGKKLNYSYIYTEPIDVDEYEDVNFSGSEEDDYISLYNFYYDPEGYDDEGDYYSSYWVNSTISGGKGDDYLEISSFYSVIDYTNGDGNDTITFEKYYGSNDEINTISTQTIKIIDSTFTKKTSGKDLIIKVGDGSIRVKNGKGHNINIVRADSDGNVIPDGLNYGSVNSIASLDNKFNDNFWASDYNSAIVDITAAKRTKAINIVGNENDNSIIGGSKNDTLDGGEGNDILTGGKGADVFYYSGGDDVINDYSIKQKDSIQLAGTSLVSGSIKGSDVVLTTDKGTLTIKNGKDAQININGTTQVYNDPYEVIIAKSDKSTSYAADENVITIDASKKSTKINIMGNANDNLIKGTAKTDSLNGGSGNDTLIGGKGNDTLTGGNGFDVFFFTNGDGADVITDYSATEGDIIRLDKKTEVTAAAYEGNNLILSIGKGKVTVQGGKSEIVNVVNDSGIELSFKKWSDSVGYREKLFVDDNFVANDLNEILVDDFNLIAGDFDQQINFNNSDQIVQVTYSLKKMGLITTSK